MDSGCRRVDEAIATFNPATGRIDLSCPGREADRLDDAALQRLVDTLDAVPGGTEGVRILNLSGNRLTRVGPLRRLTGLNWLLLSNNLIVDVSELDGLDRLEQLNVNGNRVRHLGQLARLRHLAVLRADHNELSDLGWVRNFPELRVLTVAHNRLRSVDGVEAAEHLEMIWLHANEVEGIGPFRGLSKLASVWMHDNRVASLEPLRGLGRLEVLFAQNNRIEDVGPVAGATSLGTLWLSRNPIRDLSPLSGLTGLRNLKVDHTLMTDGAALRGLIVALLPRDKGGDPGGQLESIDVSGTPLSRPDGGRISQEVLRTPDPAVLLGLMAGAERGPTIVRTVLVGKGMSGKTALARHLVGHAERFRMIPVSDRTVGAHQSGVVDLRATRGARASQPQFVVVDSGGQAEQLAANHNLVFVGSPRTLFVLCLHSGRPFNGADGLAVADESWADFYLGMLGALAVERRARGPAVSERTPVLIVVTHADIAPERKLLAMPDVSDLSRRHPELDIGLVAAFDGYRGEGTEDVLAALLTLLDRQRHVGSSMPPKILPLRAVIRRDFEADEERGSPGDPPLKFPMFTVAEFRQRCADVGITAQDHAYFLSELRALGDVVVPGPFDHASGLETVKWILNPHFANRYVCRITMDDGARAADGVMTEDRFRAVTADLDEPVRGALRQLLRETIVILDVPEGIGGSRSAGLLIPDALPVRPRGSAPAWATFTCGARGRWEHFVGEWTFFEFIARNRGEQLRASRVAPGQFSVANVSRNECVIGRLGCEALVRIDVVARTLELRVRGPLPDDCHLVRDALRGQFDGLAGGGVSWEPIEGGADPRPSHASQPGAAQPEHRPRHPAGRAATSNVFRQTAAQRWEMEFEGGGIKPISFHRVGFTILARLLEYRPSHLSDLQLRLWGSPGLVEAASSRGASPITSRQTLNLYQSTLENLRAELDVCTLEVREEILPKIEKLEREINAVTAKFGRPRNIRSPAEDAQVYVFNSLTSAYRALEGQGLENMASHFKNRIKAYDFGRAYSEPDPPIDWNVEWLPPGPKGDLRRK